MIKKSLAALVVLIILLLGFAWFWWNGVSGPVSQDSTSQDFLITRGASASQIGNNLAEKGLVKSALAFKMYVQLTARQSKIQAGEFRLSPSYTLHQTIEALTKGPVEIWVTIPEGFRREQIAARFVEVLDKDKTFSDFFLEYTKDKEGFLFPDTYLFPKDATAGKVVDVLRTTFETKVTDKMRVDAANLGYSLNQVITLASIVEREAITDEERPVIAGILYNRLRIGMGLQADATVQYVAANARCKGVLDCDWWKPPTGEELAINSAYNTYRFAGLPPAPIANPGIDSINAAIYPADTPYLYYIHDNDGQIHYGRTLEEHNANVNRYLR